jgi:uncharacterized protein
MASSSATLHEDPEKLSAATIDRHRAIVSIMEELEAIDWYDQRLEATHDAQLKEILRHNRDEEKEHAAMTLEWLRRNDSALDQHLRTYLFTKKSILEIEEEAESKDQDEDDSVTSEGCLRIGSLKEQASA